jgi:hypothetical protein
VHCCAGRPILQKLRGDFHSNTDAELKYELSSIVKLVRLAMVVAVLDVDIVDGPKAAIMSSLNALRAHYVETVLT